MPGTIQVSVLDFKGLESSSPSSQISLKVSMGKREYQIWDKGDFSFPLTTLRDNLIIALQDAEGNKISHTGVETRLVVEKGVWDEIFPLEGGGHVHMKLQFVLSEEERQRIRIMRESALKKKHDELCRSGHASPKTASVGHNEVSGSQESFYQSGLVANEASLGSIPFNMFKDAKFDVDDKDGSYSIWKQKSTNDRDEKGGDSSSKSMPQAVNVHRAEIYQDSVPSELEKVNNLKNQGPAGKADSTVRKMISAFEGSLNQLDKPSIKPPPWKPETRKIGVDSFTANPHINEVGAEKIIPSNSTLGRINTKEFEQTVTSNREKAQIIGFVKPMYGSASTIEKAAFSHRILDKHSKGNQSWNTSSKKQHSSRTLVTKEGRYEISPKIPREVEGTPNEMATSSDDHCSNRSSGLWIFPVEAKGLCITTGGKKVMDLMGGFWDEPNTRHRKLSVCDPESTGEVNADAGKSIKMSEDGKTSSEKSRPRLESSMNIGEEHIGPFRQVIRVIIMVGFATLVVLTRKRT